MSETVAEVEGTETVTKPRLTKKERFVQDFAKQSLRGQRRVYEQSKELQLAEAARDRATDRVKAAQAKLDKYNAEVTDAAEMLTSLNAEVPVFEAPEETETETETETEDSVPADADTDDTDV